jgi:hypothetical protein
LTFPAGLLDDHGATIAEQGQSAAVISNAEISLHLSLVARI